MSDTSIETYTTEDGRYRILIEYDDSYGVELARDGDMVAEIVNLHPRRMIGDREATDTEREALERGGWPLLKRYLELTQGAIAVCAVNAEEHSMLSIWPDREPDHSFSGFAYVTREQFAENSGGDPNELVEVSAELASFVPELRVQRALEAGGPAPVIARVWQNLYGELAEVDDVLQGRVYGYMIEQKVTWERPDTGETRNDWESVSSCWGFVGSAEYVMAEAKAELEAIVAAEAKATAVPA
jgi:hypothetical protein